MTETPRSHRCRWLFNGAAAIAILIGTRHAAGVDRIILRNLDIKSGRAVTSFDEDGVRIDNGAPITWDQIERGIINGKQAEFDTMLKEIGEPLYRIRQRLQVEDYAGCLVHAEKLYPRFSQRRSPSSYMVSQSLMWALMASGRREAALTPYLRCFELLRNVDLAKVSLPGERRLDFNKETGLSDELLPIWFDGPAAKQALPDVVSALRSLSKPLPIGARLYYGSMAFAAGDQQRAEQLFDGVKSEDRDIMHLRELCLLQVALHSNNSAAAAQRLAKLLPQLNQQYRPLGLYLLGKTRCLGATPTERQEGVLQLLRVPASYENAFPELAAAALYQAMLTLDKANDSQASQALRRELLSRYGQTYHATKVKSGLGSGEDS